MTQYLKTARNISAKFQTQETLFKKAYIKNK